MNISQIPDGSRDVIMEYLMGNNITVTDNVTNVSSNSLCTKTAAAQVRDILTTFTSVDIACDPQCGKNFTVKCPFMVFAGAFSCDFVLCRH